MISSRFADIFYGNTAKNGVLAAIMPQESVELLWKLLEEEPGREMTVSLETRTVTCGDVTLPFEVNDYVRWRLMNGYDDIDLTLQHEDDIAAYEKMRAEKFPFKPKTIPAKHWACNYGLAFRRGSMLASLLSQLGTGPAESPPGFQQADRG